MNQAHTPNTLFNATARRRKDAEIPIGGLLWAVFVFMVSGCDCCDEETETETETDVTPVVDAGADSTDLEVNADLGVVDDLLPDEQDTVADLTLDDGTADQETRSDVGTVDLEEERGADLAEEWVCGQFIEDSVHLMRSMLDFFTFLPYDALPCGVTADGIERARLFGVLPQYHSETISTFAHRSEVPDSTITYFFVDTMPDGDEPSLIYALRIDYNLDMGNTFSGLIWNAGNGSDLSRYDRAPHTESPALPFSLSYGIFGRDSLL